MKLCFKEGKETQTHRDTADWIAYVQEKEEPKTALRRGKVNLALFLDYTRGHIQSNRKVVLSL